MPHFGNINYTKLNNLVNKSAPHNSKRGIDCGFVDAIFDLLTTTIIFI